MDILAQAFITLAITIDPIGVAALFTGLTPGVDFAHRRTIALRGTIIAGIVLVAFALLGSLLLRTLGVGIPAFRIAGGVLLFMLAIDMVFVRHSGLRATTASEEAEAERKSDISVFPLAIPLLAGPGAITSMVLLMQRAGGDLAMQSGILLVLGVVLGLTLAALLMAATIMRMLGVTGTNVVSRVSGIILAALAAQFVIDGWQGAFGAS